MTAPQQQAVLKLLHAPRFADQAPAEIYASLLDEGVYHCSIRTMYRVLDQHDEVRERRQQLRHPIYRKPELLAERPNEVWSWDITKLMGPTKWRYFYLYVILDIFSRRVVGWCVADAESAVLFKPLLDDAIAKHNVPPGQLTLHADRGGPMKAKATALLLADLGVTRSHNRPHTSNDNPFSESHFKTLKYQPTFPQRFGCIEDARSFCRRFFDWYNQDHHHAGIGLMTPDQVHYGQTDAVHAARQHTLDQAFRDKPGALRQQDADPTRQADRGLDQSTSVNAEDPSLNADPGCIKVVDTFRLGPAHTCYTSDNPATQNYASGFYGKRFARPEPNGRVDRLCTTRGGKTTTYALPSTMRGMRPSSTESGWLWAPPRRITRFTVSRRTR